MSIKNNAVRYKGFIFVSSNCRIGNNCQRVDGSGIQQLPAGFHIFSQNPFCEVACCLTLRLTAIFCIIVPRSWQSFSGYRRSAMSSTVIFAPYVFIYYAHGLTFNHTSQFLWHGCLPNIFGEIIPSLPNNFLALFLLTITNAYSMFASSQTHIRLFKLINNRRLHDQPERPGRFRRAAARLSREDEPAKVFSRIVLAMRKYRPFNFTPPSADLFSRFVGKASFAFHLALRKLWIKIGQKMPLAIYDRKSF